MILSRLSQIQVLNCNYNKEEVIEQLIKRFIDLVKDARRRFLGSSDY